MSVQPEKRRPAKRGVVRTCAFAAATAFLLAMPAAYGEEAHVMIDNFSFTPETLNIKAGTTVTWENGDDIPHNVVASDKSIFRSKVMDTEQNFSFTFTTTGTFEYFCALHPHMRGRIIVTP